MRYCFATKLTGIVMAVALLAPAEPACAQQSWSSAALPSDHWSIEATRQLAALGLAPVGHDPTRGALTQREAGALLDYAAATDSAAPAIRLARAYRARYREEFDLTTAPLSLFRGSSVRAGYESRSDVLRPGHGYEDGHPYGDWQDATPLPDHARAYAHATIQVTPASWFGARIGARTASGDTRLVEASATALAGPVVLWAGRRTLDWSVGPGDGLVVNDRAFDGAGLGTLRPIRLPGFLRHVGHLHAEVAVAQIDFTHTCHDPTITPDAPPCADAWFAATRAMVVPHPRVSVGVTRAAVFGGEGNTGIDAFALFSILIGKHAGQISELDNQVFALDAGYRLPTERWVPVRVYVEWGFEDSAGAWMNVPGILAGIEAPLIPGTEALSLSLERASFARSCCGNPIWYRHSVFHDGWVVDDRPLGHRLGGHGVEWTARAGWTGAEARIRARAELFTRETGFENIFAETRSGRSSGLGIRIDARPHPFLEIELRGSYEDAADWRTTSAGLALRAFL